MTSVANLFIENNLLKYERAAMMRKLILEKDTHNLKLFKEASKVELWLHLVAVKRNPSVNVLWGVSYCPNKMCLKQQNRNLAKIRIFTHLRSYLTTFFF